MIRNPEASNECRWLHSMAARPRTSALTPEDRAALAELRTQRTLTYDTQEHDWRSPVVDAMGVEALQTLEPATDGRSRGGEPRRRRAVAAEGTTRSPDVRDASSPPTSRSSNGSCSRTQDVCARHGSTLCEDGLVFQREPSFRRHAPSPNPTGRPHRDADYGHSAFELNCGCLSQECGGSNSLWCESAPGAEDYAPFAVRYGEAVLFWGNRCRIIRSRTTRHHQSVLRLSVSVPPVL